MVVISFPCINICQILFLYAKNTVCVDFRHQKSTAQFCAMLCVIYFSDLIDLCAFSSRACIGPVLHRRLRCDLALSGESVRAVSHIPGIPADIVSVSGWARYAFWWYCSFPIGSSYLLPAIHCSKGRFGPPDPAAIRRFVLSISVDTTRWGYPPRHLVYTAPPTMVPVPLLCIVLPMFFYSAFWVVFSRVFLSDSLYRFLSCHIVMSIAQTRYKTNLFSHSTGLFIRFILIPLQ